MQAQQPISKIDLKAIYDEHFDGLRRFLYYKCGEIELAEESIHYMGQKVHQLKWAQLGLLINIST